MAVVTTTREEVIKTRTNAGTADRVIRFILGVVLGYLVLTHPLSHYGGAIGRIVFGIVALIGLVTTIIGFCPLYRLMGIRTCPAPKGK